MKELDMIKAFAELEGVKLTYINVWNDCFDANRNSFSPITDLALLAKAMFKYEAEIDYVCNDVTIYTDNGLYTADYEAKGGIPNAIIEVILKSRGKWVK